MAGSLRTRHAAGMATLLARCASFLWIGVLAAQSPAPSAAPVAPPPAIVVLLRHPRAIEIDTLRARLAQRTIDDGETAAPRVEAAADGVRGRCLDVDWTAAARRGRFAIDAEALGHLPTLARHRLARHRAHLVIAAEAPTAGDANDRHRAYRALALVARALLDDDSVGLRLVDHERFEVANEDARLRLGAEDPLAAFAPVEAPGVVVLLRAARRLDEANLRAAVKRGFDVDLPADEDSATDFVVVDDPIAMVKVRGTLLMLTMRPGRALEPTPGLELRVHRAIEDHQASLLVTAVAPDDRGSAGREVTRALARTVAGLWDEDCLALHWSTDPRLVAASDDLLRNLRADDPVAATLGNAPAPVISTTADDAEMEAAIAEARRRFGEAERHFRGGGRIHVKFPFATRSGGHEHIWVDVRTLENGEVRGTLGNEPIDVEGLRIGSEVARNVGELTDWLYEENGQLRGHFSGKVLERRMQQQRERGNEPQPTGGRKR